MSTPEATHHDLLAFAVTPASNGNARKVQAVTLVDSAGAEVTFGALPTGAATAAKQDTGNTSLATIATNSALEATAALQTAGNASLTTLATKPSTGTLSSVANSATSVTVLAANASRKGATIYNDDTAAVLKIKFGATASATSFVYAIPAGGYFEVPFGYTGIIDGIASVATGSARVTELT